MPIRRSNPPPDPTALLLDYCRAFFQVGANAYARALKIGAAYAKQTADGAALAKNESTPQVLGSYLFGLHNYYLEMATVLPLAIEGHLQKRSSLQDHQGTLQVAPTRASMHSVDGKPTLLPARITDASQGWAIYLVATDRAQAQLRSPSEFTVVDVGR